MTNMPTSVERIADAQPPSKAPWDPPRMTATSITHTAAPSDATPAQAAPGTTPPPARQKWGVVGDGWLGYPSG